jgi:hypothetical protein
LFSPLLIRILSSRRLNFVKPAAVHVAEQHPHSMHLRKEGSISEIYSEIRLSFDS